MSRLVILALCFIHVIASTASAQSAASAQEPQARTPPVGAAQQPATPPPFLNVKGFSADYQVGAGDLLDIQVVGNEGLRQSLRVANSGEISFPMLGLVKVVDMTTFDVESEIAQQLRQRGLVEQAEVLVSVTEYQAKPIYVSGAVETPGEFVMSQELTVIDAILLAGGLRFNAADEALLHRRVSNDERKVSAPAGTNGRPAAPAQGMDTIKIDLRSLKEGRFLEASPALRRGDVLVIPEQQMNAFFVVGDVVDPRNFFYSPGKNLTASQAISWAGGPTPTAKMSNGLLVRYDDQGRRTEMKMDYAAILKGEQADIPVLPNDILFIPGSKVKSLAHGLVQLTDNMVMAASFRVARSYQMPDRPELARPPQ